MTPPVIVLLLLQDTFEPVGNSHVFVASFTVYGVAMIVALALSYRQKHRPRLNKVVGAANGRPRRHLQ